MTKIERIECDCCGEHVNNAVLGWEFRASHVAITCPPDGINGGQWSMDVCRVCRAVLHDAIKEAIDGLRARAKQEKELQSGVRNREKGWG